MGHPWDDESLAAADRSCICGEIFPTRGKLMKHCVAETPMLESIWANEDHRPVTRLEKKKGIGPSRLTPQLCL
jgi:hypothetical protein